MRKYKKIILSLMLIISLLSTDIYAFNSEPNKDFNLNNIIEFFPSLFYENSKIISSLDSMDKLDKNIEIIKMTKDNFIEELKINIETYIHYSNLDSFPNREIFFSNNSKRVLKNSIIPIEKNNEFISNYYNKNYLKVSLIDETLYIEGVNTSSQTWSLVFKDSDGHDIDLSYLSTMPINNNRFKKKFRLINSSNIESMTISLNKHILDKYYSSEYVFIFDKDKKGFKNPLIYEDNRKRYEDNASLKAEDFLSIEHIDKLHMASLKNKALEITKGIEDDYEKLLAIHTWVSNNIYYDLDSLKYNKRGPNDAYHTLMDNKAVCQGYAELSLALCRSIGIPTKLVYGYALGVVEGENSWTNSSFEKNINHAWNEAYIDGRWIIFDTTWDSSNRYEEGKFTKEENSLKYFDPSLKLFSQTHRIDEIVDI